MENITSHIYSIAVCSIVFLSILLRFIDYNDRWGLAYDQSHDALVARHAVQSFSLPLLGPFSSAGPFQTGGEWYWLIMAGTMLYPFSIMTPWIFMTSLYVLFVFLIIKVGEELLDKHFALIVGVLAAVSPAQVSQSVNVTNQTPQALFALLSIWFAVRFLRTRKDRFIFLLSLCVSTAASIHLQGVALIFLLFFTFALSGIPQLRTMSAALLGLFIPWIPVLIERLSICFIRYLENSLSI